MLTLAHLTLGAPPSESIAAAQAAGFGAVGLRIAPRRPEEAFPVQMIGAPATVRTLRAQARDAGVIISNVQAYQLFPDTRWEDLQGVVETAHQLGAGAIVAYSFDPDHTRFLDLFRRYCAEAAAAGLRVALEFMPYSRVRNFREALCVVEQSGAPNAGVLIDVLHFHRSGSQLTDVIGVERGHLAHVQLCDTHDLAKRMSEQELITEARTARLPPGQGELPLFDLLDALPPGLELEHEAAPAARAALSAHDKAHAARADMDRFMTGYGQHRASVQQSAVAR